MNYLLDHWRGKQTLRQSFWINFIFVSILTCLIEYSLYRHSDQSLPDFLVIAICYFVFFHVFVFIWQCVGILRVCDENIKNYISSGWTRAAQLSLITGFAATLIWGITFGQKMWMLKKDNDLLMVEHTITPAYTINIIDNQHIQINGTLTPGITKALKQQLDKTPDVESIELNSTGGNIFEARGIAKLIQDKQLNTHVSTSCFSSCTTVFVAGKKRTMGEIAKLGFHQYKVNSNKLFGPNVNVKKELDRDIEFFLKQGVSQAFLERAFTRPHDDIWFPNHNELIEAGFINHITETNFPDLN